MAHIRIACPDCGMKLKVSPDHIGKTGRCSKCNAKFRIERPASVGQAPAPSASSDPASDVTQAEASTGSSADVTQAEPSGPDVTAPAEQTVAEQSDAIEATMAEGPLANADSSADDAEARQAAEDDVPAEWNVSDVILDTYEVKRVHEGGAMGKVYRVHHTGWNMDLAVKSPRDGYFHTQAQKDTFIDECQTWINLGLHPHIVSCYYVRTLGGIPRVFAEYVEGGDLKDWIDEKKLYQGEHDEVLKRMLDIAIQFAWGLHYAHEHEDKFVHQDVKPGNVMMTPDGEAKVSDFGLAKARGGIDEDVAHGDGEQSILVSTGGMTPAFCSPEQANKQPLSRKTDIWSWGLSVLQMFTGDVTWPSGTVAAPALEGYVEMGAEDESIPKMPDALVDLLRRCFQQDPEDRPQDMAEVAGKLKKIYEDPNIYQEPTSDEYPREEPKAAELLADGLNNRAVSMLDLGRKEDAEELFEQAIKTNPSHLASTYNRGIVNWQRGAVTDAQVIEDLELVRANSESPSDTVCALSLVHFARGDRESALPLTGQASIPAADDSGMQGAAARAASVVPPYRCDRSMLEGHTKYASCVAFSADGAYAISGSRDGTVRLWDIQAASIIQTLRTRGVNAVGVSADGRHAVSGGADRSVRFWDCRSGRCLRVLQGHREFITGVYLSDSGRLALSVDHKKSMRVWDTESGRCLQVIEGHARDNHFHSVTCLAVSSDGRLGLSGSEDKTLRLWDLATGKCLRIMKGHSADITCLAVDADFKIAITGSARHFSSSSELADSLRTWDLQTGTCLSVLRGHTSGVRSVSLSRDGGIALSGSCEVVSGSDNSIRLWDVRRSRCLRTFPGIFCNQMTVRVSADSRVLLAGGGLVEKDEGKVCIVACEMPRTRDDLLPLMVSLPRSHSQVSTASTRAKYLLNRVDGAIAAMDADGALTFLHDLRTIPGFGRAPECLSMCARVTPFCRRTGLAGAWVKTQLGEARNSVTGVAFTGDGKVIVSATYEGKIRLNDAGTGTTIREIPVIDRRGGVECIMPSCDGSVVFSGGSDGDVRMWNTSTGELVRAFEGHRSQVNSIAVSPDERWLLSGSGGVGMFGRDTSLRLWEVSSGRCVRRLSGHRDNVNCCVFGSDGRTVVAGCADGTIHMWDVSTGRMLGTAAAYSSGIGVSGLSVGRDGRTLLSCGANGDDLTVHVWDLCSGECRKALRCHSRLTTSAVLTPDCRFAVTGGDDDMRICIWNLETGECVSNMEGHTKPIVAVSASPDGRYVLSGSRDGTVRLWELDWQIEARALADWSEEATPIASRFLMLHTPYEASLPKDRVPSEQEAEAALRRVGRSQYGENDFDPLLKELSLCGLGWLRPEGVKRELARIAADWWAEPPQPWGPAQDLRGQKQEQRPVEARTGRTAQAKGAEIASAQKPVPARTGLGETAGAPQRPGRNDPCPCRSGKKYKHCCGKPALLARPKAGHRCGVDPDSPVKAAGEPIDQKLMDYVIRKSGINTRRILLMRDGPAKKAAMAKLMKEIRKLYDAEVAARKGQASAGSRANRSKGEACACGADNPPANTYCKKCGKPLPDRSS